MSEGRPSDPQPKTVVTHLVRSTRAHGRLAIMAIALFAPFTQVRAQDPGAKPRLELADSARRPTRNAASANERVNAPVAAPASALRPAAAPAIPLAAGYRADFVRNQSALGVVLYAPAFASTIAHEPISWAAGYLLVAGGSFVAAAEISRDMTVTDPMHSLATGLPIRGAIAGSMLAALADMDGRSTAGTILFSSVAGTTAALWRGRTMDEGEAAATLFGSDVLGLAGWGLATGAGMENDGRANPTRLGMALGGMVIGAPLGQAYAALAGYNVTAGDLTAMYAAGGVGMLAGLTAIANGGHSEREVAAAMTIGGFAGLVAGDRLLTRRYDHTRDQGGMMIAGGVAGGLMGAGVALLADGSRERWSAWTGAFTTAGAAAGVAWAQYYLKPKPDGVARLGGLTLNPAAVVAAATGMRGSYTLGSIRF
jgi:hypothetical protein